MPDLNRLIAALSKAAAYPEGAGEVKVIQTQMSVVFLTSEYVYKIKKPVNLGYVDYTELKNRRHFCEREVALNQRLCPSAYLGVVPITADGDQLTVEGTGTPVEYAVKMRHLPEDMLLDKLLQQGKVTPAMMAQVATHVARFHRNADTNEEISRFGSLEAVIRNIEENFGQTEKYAGDTVSAKQLTVIQDFTRRFVHANDHLFFKRMQEGHIRDCHGDLHAQHICFCHDLCIFDCIEFNDRFRYGDTASEVAFLAMDLDRSGRADLARAFVAAYISESGDVDLPSLLNFYKCYRAYIRAKVNCFKLNDPCIPEAGRQEALIAAQGYFDLAAAYTRTKPLLIIMVGFVGSGKTTLAQELAGRLGAIYLSSDVTRKTLADVPLTENRHYDPGDGIYSAEFTRRTYDTLYQEASQALADGCRVILDAAFLKKGERETARQIAAQTGADCYTIECQADTETTRTRLAKRLTQDSISDGTWNVHLKQQGWFEPLEADESGCLMVDTTKPLYQNVRWVLAKLTGDDPGADIK